MALSPQRQQQWQRILDLSRHMQALADAEEWQKVVDMESDRQVLLKAFFESPVSEQDASEVARGIEQILSSDRALAQRGLVSQQALIGSVQAIRSGRRAVAAYHRCGDK